MRTFPYPVGGILCLCNWRPYDHWPFPAIYYEKFKGTATLKGLYRGHPNTQPPGFYQLKFYCICFLKYLSIWAVYLFCLHIYCPQSQLPSHVLPHYKGDSVRKQDCSHQKISSLPFRSPQWYTRACGVHPRAEAWVHAVPATVASESSQWFSFLWDF